MMGWLSKSQAAVILAQVFALSMVRPQGLPTQLTCLKQGCWPLPVPRLLLQVAVMVERTLFL